MAAAISFTKDELHDIYGQVTSKPGSGAQHEVTTGTAVGSSTAASAHQSHPEGVAAPAPGQSNTLPTDPGAVSQSLGVTPTAPFHHGDNVNKHEAVAPPTVIAAAPTSEPPRRDSDVGPRNEAAPEHHHHHHHHHHHKDKATSSAAAATSSSSSSSFSSSSATSTNLKTNHKSTGITYGDTTHLSAPPNSDNKAPRRQSLADSPYRGNIHTTVSSASPSKKWSFSMGDFGLKLPKQESNAVTQELNKDGSVSMQGGQGRVPRGIGSIASTVKRGSVDATVSERDPAKKWSLSHGDFGLKAPKQESNAVAQELGRDGRVSISGEQNGIGLGGGGLRKYSGVGAVPLGRQGARGIGSISDAVRRGSVDASVSSHDPARKWSLRDADLGLKWPGQKAKGAN